MKKEALLVLLITCGLCAQVTYAQPGVSADSATYNVKRAISVSFTNGPGNAADWIGIYKNGDVPGTAEATLWNYVNGTQTATVGITNGSVNFPGGVQTEGGYWVGFFENDGYTILASDSFQVVDLLPRVSTDKTLYDLGDTIIVYFKNGPNNPTDWIGIYKFGDIPGPTPSTIWYYVNGTQSPTVGISEGSVTFTQGLADTGMYWARFLANDGYEVLDSSAFSVSNLSDSIPPVAPVINVIPSSFANIVMWTDVPGEFNETYNVYASPNPIADVKAPGVELVKPRISEGAEVFNHILRSALVDKSRTLYYAVTCRDYAGNVGPPGTFGPVTNTAKGVPTVSTQPPTPFVADGDLSEWAGIPPFIMQSALGTASVPANNTVNGDADLSAVVKLAVDSLYLYVMFDVTDDLYYHPQTLSPWERDEPDLYIGLYNLTTSHIDYGTGATADYQIRFDEDRIRLDANADCDSLLFIGTNYFHDAGKSKITPGYVIEARIPLADLATKRNGGVIANDSIHWKIGDKIPFTIGINDNDNGTNREGMIFYSPQPTETAYYDVSSWTYTWISDEVTGVDDHPPLAMVYALNQNYPNPFNPNTIIQYSIAKPGLVRLRVFDVLGRLVAELVNGHRTPGNYTVDFQAGKKKLSSGVYFYELRSGEFAGVKKMLLLK
jgi:hypothetical protein